MKKMILTAIFMVAIGGALSAQTTKPGNGTPGTNTNSPAYVDANKNKVCDNYENNTRPAVNRGQGQGRREEVMAWVTGRDVQTCNAAEQAEAEDHGNDSLLVFKYPKIK
ncbi:MAG: hypothetical protein IPK31_11475 [Chitinophagaceae bacterium]|nr:hypothetical protein [Chitinophagaceae bacterium]